MFVFLEKNSKFFCGFDNLFSNFENVFEYFSILERRYSNVILIGVKDNFLRVSRYGDHFDICDADAFFDMIVID